jgi:hypothetical protein
MTSNELSRVNSESLNNVFNTNDSVASSDYRNQSYSQLQLTILEEEETNPTTTARTTTTTNEDYFNDNISKMTRKEYLETIFGPSLHITNLTLMQKGKHIMHSSYFHMFIVLLIILDSIFIAVELLLTAENCEGKDETLNFVTDIFKYLGLSILSIFMIELLFKIIFLNKDIIKSKLEIFDAIVVVVSFVLELVFLGKKDLETIGAIISLFRFWRIIRIVNGICLFLFKFFK